MFETQVTRHRGSVTVHLTGELDIEAAPGLKDCFDQLVEQGDATIEVDMRWLTFCDSRGISALIHGYEACRAAGGHLRITNEQGPVARVLDLTGVRPLLHGEIAKPSPDLDHETDTAGAHSPLEAPGIRSGILRLEVDVRDGEWVDMTVAAMPSLDDVTTALASLDQHRHTEMTIVDRSGAYLTVGGGRSRYHVYIGAHDHDDRIILQNTAASDGDRAAELVVDGTTGRYAARDIVDLHLASAAVREFLRSGRPHTELRWRTA